MNKRTLSVALAAGLALAAGSVTLLTACSKSGSHSAHVERYQCPMHPTIITDHPDNCPICGMKLVKMESDAPNAAHESSPVSGETAEGMSTVTIDPARQPLIGLATAEAALGKVGGEIRTTGRVEVDETRVYHANVKISGFAEHVYADFVGNVLTVETRGYWRDVSVSPKDQGYHYNRNAETYYLVGEALGRGMAKLRASSNR